MNATSAGYIRTPSLAVAMRQGGPQELRTALLEERARTLALAQAWHEALGPQLQVPLRPELNPPLWELGHIAWFQEAWIARNPERARGAACPPDVRRGPSSRQGADACFDSSRVPHDSRWSLPLPGYEAVLAWLASTLETTLALLDGLVRGAGDDELYFFRLTCLHEAMHSEAACYMGRSLGLDLGMASPQDAGDPSEVLQVPAQAFELGSRGPGFAFDNELQPHRVDLAAFEIDAHPVSWSRFGEFVAAGGYEEPRWWTPEGWAWRQGARPRHPSFPQGAAPAVHLSAWEAEAWCRWRGRRLPSEAEWECAATTAGMPWGAVWEWTASDFLPYPGFRPHPYQDYSQPWFGSRRVLRGACLATSPRLAHPRYRNFFEPQRVDIFAGFRSCA